MELKTEFQFTDLVIADTPTILFIQLPLVYINMILVRENSAIRFLWASFVSFFDNLITVSRSVYHRGVIYEIIYSKFKIKDLIFFIGGL